MCAYSWCADAEKLQGKLAMQKFHYHCILLPTALQMVNIGLIACSYFPPGNSSRYNIPIIHYSNAQQCYSHSFSRKFPIFLEDKNKVLFEGIISIKIKTVLLVYKFQCTQATVSGMLELPGVPWQPARNQGGRGGMTSLPRNPTTAVSLLQELPETQGHFKNFIFLPLAGRKYESEPGILASTRTLITMIYAIGVDS